MDIRLNEDGLEPLPLNRDKLPIWLKTSVGNGSDSDNFQQSDDILREDTIKDGGVMQANSAMKEPHRAGQHQHVIPSVNSRNAQNTRNNDTDREEPGYNMYSFQNRPMADNDDQSSHSKTTTAKGRLDTSSDRPPMSSTSTVEQLEHRSRHPIMTTNIGGRRLCFPSFFAVYFDEYFERKRRYKSYQATKRMVVPSVHLKSGYSNQAALLENKSYQSSNDIINVPESCVQNVDSPILAIAIHTQRNKTIGGVGGTISKFGMKTIGGNTAIPSVLSRISDSTCPVKVSMSAPSKPQSVKHRALDGVRRNEERSSAVPHKPTISVPDQVVVTCEGVPVSRVPKHFHLSYCERMATFITKLHGQPPHCEITTKFDRAAHVPGVSQLQRGGWAQYVDKSGDSVRDMLVNFSNQGVASLNYEDSDYPAGVTSGKRRRQSVAKKCKDEDLQISVSRTKGQKAKWSLYIQIKNIKIKIGESSSQESVNRLLEQARCLNPSWGTCAIYKQDEAVPPSSDIDKSNHCNAFIDPSTGVYMEQQMGTYCSVHALNAMFGSIRLGCSPPILQLVEKTLQKLERSQPTDIDDGFMDHQAIVSLGRNLGVYMISMALDQASLALLFATSTTNTGVNVFIEHLVRVKRFILGRPHTRNIEGHFVCVQVKQFSSTDPASGKKKKQQTAECSVQEWLLIDSMQPQAKSYSSFASLLKAFIGNKRAEVPPFLIVPLIFSEKALDSLTEHISNFGSIFDCSFLSSDQSACQMVGEVPEQDESSLMMMLVERKTAPAHGLSLCMILSLLSGQRSLKEFGLQHQTKSDFGDRVGCGNASAVQRFVEGSDGPMLLQQLSCAGHCGALVLTSLSRVINNPNFVALVMQTIVPEKGKNMGLRGLNVKASQQLKQQAGMTMLHLLRRQQPGFEAKLTEHQNQTVLYDIECVVGAYFEMDIRNMRRTLKRRS